ncbi:MAG TPA: capsule assembly Wzi family protein, partial [Candidatus Sulfotelmatobacter sp.]|nr:capsule assembly Wzi family protein [Candidatus Sulfotelmatobacter sp.]
MATPVPSSSDDDRQLASDNPVKFLRNLAQDQKAIWTSPFKVKIQDLNWLVPMAGLTAGLINADAELASRINPTNSFSKHAGTISNAGLGIALGGSGGIYLLGKIRGDAHQKETGILATEAVVNSYAFFTAVKLVTQRARPTDGNGRGEFFNSSSISNSSFPSGHAIITWSAASVLAHEYPGPVTKIFAYGLAATVSAARVADQKHFPSDVLVGSVAGWLIGRQVYKAHHDPDLPGAAYGTFTPERNVEDAPERASAYVPMDSWVYPAFDRLTALGVTSSGLVGLRPWTRKECSRILEEISGEVDESNPDETWHVYAALAGEFAPELNGHERDNIALDSVYGRITGISGPPLTDGYHFGQTIVNDFGRPYQRGVNGLTGFTSSGGSGVLGFYVRGEYEHAPSAPGFTQAQQNAIQNADFKLAQPALSIPGFDQFRLLDTYLSLNIKGWQTSFGKQTLWTGPTQDPFLWSNNAEPIYMLRVDQTHPARLPSIFKFLGPVRSEYWVGKMTGHHWVDTQDATVGTLGQVSTIGRTLSKQPMVNGLKVNFKPTPNFEFGVGRTGIFGGPDFPITPGSIKHALFSTSNSQGRGRDPGDRRSTFDFSYRIPGFRKWLTLYEDSFVEDEISPIGYPRRAAHNPGIYLSQVPGIPHLDARFEASYTNLPGLIQTSEGGFFYWNVRYKDGYTNKGNILGNGTVGRQGIAYRAESTYWVAADKTLKFGYREAIADDIFLQGGNLRDAFFRSEWSLTPKVSLSSFLQYEWWNFPLLSAGKKQNDFTASFQLT